MFLLHVLILTGAARVNLSLARCKNSEIIYLQPTDHVVVKACTVNAAMIAEEESLRSPEETSGMITFQKLYFDNKNKQIKFNSIYLEAFSYNENIHNYKYVFR